jgi:hypothetical protein
VTTAAILLAGNALGSNVEPSAESTLCTPSILTPGVGSPPMIIQPIGPVGPVPVAPVVVLDPQTVDPGCVGGVPTVPIPGARVIDESGALRVNVTHAPIQELQFSKALDIGSLPPISGTFSILGTPSISVDSMPPMALHSMPAIDIASLPAVGIKSVPPIKISALPAVDVASMPPLSGSFGILAMPGLAIEALPEVSLGSVPPVEISALPAVDVASMPPLSGSFGILAMPGLAIEALPEVSLGSVPPVEISALPAVDVASMPPLTIAAMPSQDIVFPASINVTVTSLPNPVVVKQLDPLRDRVVVTGALSGGTSGAFYEVPSGKTLLITDVSADVLPSHLTINTCNPQQSIRVGRLTIDGVVTFTSISEGLLGCGNGSAMAMTPVHNHDSFATPIPITGSVTASLAYFGGEASGTQAYFTIVGYLE